MKNEFKCVSSFDTLPFGQPSEKSQCPPWPLALWPLGPDPGGAEGAVRARSARAPPAGSPAPQGPTQGVSISTALAKHRSENMRSVFTRSDLIRVGGCRGA